jgi:putative nucleotidyltransferase with HDIG domain
MSSDPQSGAPSPGPSPEPSGEGSGGGDPDLAAFVAARGGPLLDALDAHTPGARRHGDGTASYAFAAAAWLGLAREHAELVRETARLHEVGKLYVPAELFARPPEQLDPAERKLVESHPEAGAKLARGAGLPESVCQWIESVAESFDGAGREGLAGEAIPVEARITRVGCAYEALTSDAALGASVRERKSAADYSLRARSGTELDPRVVEALLFALEGVAS